jgi:hypothetical protein
VEVEDTFLNPWCVDDVSAFLKFCCPECNYHIPDIQMFSDHAAENHINSRALFGDENTNVPQEQLQQPFQSNNDDGNEDIFFDDLDNGELSAAAEVEPQTQLVQPNIGVSGGTKSVSITPAQKQRAEKNLKKALALKKARQQSQQPLSEKNPPKSRVTVKKLDEALKERGAPYSLIGSKAEKEKVLKDFNERDENHPNNVEFNIGDLEEVLAEKRTIFDGDKLLWISIENLKKKDIPKDFKRATITKFLRDSPLVRISYLASLLIDRLIR